MAVKQETIDKYVGKVFDSRNYGKFTVLAYNGTNDVLIKFLDTGYETSVSSDQVRIGSVLDYRKPTIYGVGIVGSKLSKVELESKVYKTWRRIISRCYNLSLVEKRPTYKDCTVSEDFLYYPTFKEWYFNQPNHDNKGWVIDKDLLCRDGFKIYSPDTCVFLPPELNSLLTTTKAKRGDLPIGVCLRSKDTKYSATCCIDGVDKHLGLYDKPEDAFEAYKKAREDYLKVKADKYKDQLCEKAYNALYNYEVKITD